mmetsp:Transcript_12759/g.27630  ORF Transcript_12759/g.27630 Transcript_12759/m.27630 type:complete len:241 (+) Transcript_12759:115-837(+)|eukprot:CAMPEP_0202891450 /NCGR_PEP_ID=MMETSP1392-20130828/1500_1 /ASSEMBLY_ACC=CAM_ASM_000868 /TAXON_ID=225041 /ORGANISM="Chlamydomonas chlamydogama, Strain SAG 11-48b" /LENGTH=240 /DNA_ID=CAMNT_0049575197 /DNA_START=59 /DNA_END=781 /DNA_ORIENTATION=+
MDGKLDAKQFGSAMSQIAHGQAMLAAVRDYKQEVEEQQKLAQQADQQQDYNISELLDDPELQKLHADRIAQMQQEREQRVQMQQQGHGQITEITEGEFLEIVTKTEHVICHFFHRDFERCKIMDKHLQVLAKKHFETRFIKLSAPDSPFFTVKLNIKMLPCVVCFKNGVSIERVVGFDGLGGTDDFETDNLEMRFMAAGVVSEPKVNPEDQDQLLDGPSSKVRKGFAYKKTESDEDSDFD